MYKTAKINPSQVLVLILFLGLVFVGAKYGLIKLPFAVSSDMLVVPDWGRLECAPTDTDEGLQTISVPKSGASVFCDLNEFTDKCFPKVKVSNVGIVDDVIKYQLCNNDGSGCGGTQTTSISTALFKSGAGFLDLPILVAGKKYFVQCEEGFGLNKECTIEKTYRPWKVFRYDSGRKFTAVSDSCTIPGSFLPQIPTQESTPANFKLTRTGDIGSKWIHYISRFIFVPKGLNVVNYKGQEVYCNAGEIFELQKITMKDGSAVTVSPTASQTDSDAPSYYETIGRKIAQEQCCYNPNLGDTLCGPDFKLRPPTPPPSCFTDAQCPGGGQPIPSSSTSYDTYACQSGKCVKSSHTVQCTSNSACSSGQICDFSLTNYGKCITQTGGDYCGDNVCSKTESEMSCSNDCGTQKLGIPLYVWLLIAGLVVAVIIIGYKAFRR